MSLGRGPRTVPVAVVIEDHDDSLHRAAGHPERPERLRAIREALDQARGLVTVPRLAPGVADAATVLTVHTPEHLARVQTVARTGGGWLDPDTYCTPSSYEIALSALGTSIGAVDAVASGQSFSAFALMRPPGHHATAGAAMGFCLFNNAAIAVRHAQRVHQIERVAVVDIDVHHGNGTQDIFYDDPSVLYCSLHQFPFYPGTGQAGETGAGRGIGATVNVPLDEGTGGGAWMRAFEARIVPTIERFRPHLVCVSAGFDGHAADPIGGLQLTAATYGEVARSLAALARSAGAAGTVWLLEGGYDLYAIAESVGETVTALAAAGGESA